VPQQPDRLAVAIPGLYPNLNTLYRWGGWPLTEKVPMMYLVSLGISIAAGICVSRGLPSRDRYKSHVEGYRGVTRWLGVSEHSCTFTAFTVVLCAIVPAIRGDDARQCIAGNCNGRATVSDAIGSGNGYSVKKGPARRYRCHGGSAAICGSVGSMGSAAAKIVGLKSVR
jgi:hypothetical protein